MVTKAVRAERAQKRGSGKIGGNSALVSSDGQEQKWEDAAVSSEPTPEEGAQFAEEVERLLDMLDKDLRVVAKLKLDAYTNKEIAEQLGYGERAVKHRLAKIRKIWER